MSEIKQLKTDENSKLFDTTGMFFKEFNSDYRQIRYYTLLVVQKSEIIKNAVKHGNNCDINKKVKVWYYFDTEKAHIIVEDEGEGFKDLEGWNTFNKKRINCFVNQNFEEMEKYVSFRTKHSDENDSGNALFAAVEYWNAGVVFNKKRNKVAVLKTFPKKRHGINLDSV
jgi:serine/threonine-protein kinase RsbW